MHILDTCALLWLADNPFALSPTATDAIRNSSDSLFVSAITGFELATKHKKGRLILPLPPDEWYLTALRKHGIREVPIDGRISVLAPLLPDIHSDPCDRCISEYPDVTVIW